jgi:hypothetical protein
MGLEIDEEHGRETLEDTKVKTDPTLPRVQESAWTRQSFGLDPSNDAR